jgi:methylglutaconyl-CoA hydratase
MEPTPPLLIDATDPAITVLSLNRPQRRNALSIELMDALRDAVTTASNDRARRVIILRGAGPVFCAGLDFHEAMAPENAHRSSESLASLYRAICASPLVTIAAAYGAALGGGAGLIAACDFAIAADDLRLGYPEVHRGLVAAVVTCLLRRQLSDRQIRELILLGQTLTADQSLALGLVSRTVPAASLDDAARQLAREVSQGAPGAIARTKELLNRLHPIDEEIALALDVHRQARNSAEAQEGIAAFLEKRPPRWGDRQ